MVNRRELNMYRIIRVNSLIKNVAILTVFLSISIYSSLQHFFPDISIYKVFTISTIVSTALIFLINNSTITRGIWKLIGKYKKSLFPDLNGSWEGKILTEGGNDILIRALIRQTLTETEIDIHGKTMKSITLETTPVNEKGQNKLYYVYRSHPKTPGWPSYTGSILFDVRNLTCKIDGVLELSGYYYTDRKTVGNIMLRQVSKNNTTDVSYY